MQALSYTITALSSVVLPVNVGEMNTVNTRKYINGSSILGMFAQQYIKQKKLGTDAHHDPTFRIWFLSEHLTFTNAYIIKEEKGERTVHYPTPVSMQRRKHEEDRAFDLLFTGFGAVTEPIKGFAPPFVSIRTISNPVTSQLPSISITPEIRKPEQPGKV
jgi:hypothetical protein